MKENICSIPINDILLPKTGCPICRMRHALEDKHIEHVTGAAMMEPLVRVQTNEKGFCAHHLELITERGNRLSVALVLETHLQEIIENMLKETAQGNPQKKEVETLKKLRNSCYVCERIEKDMLHFFETLFKEHEQNEDFRQLITEQEFICLDHFSLLYETALNTKISKKAKQKFLSDITALCTNYLKELKNDVSQFCSMFDYRNNGGDWGNSKDSIERSTEFLS